MQYVTTILWQIVIMFILVAVGYCMFRFKKISIEGSKALGNILIFLSLPCVIINSFLVERTPERVQSFFLSALMALIAIVIAIVVSRLLVGKNAIDAFSGAFSNPGFFGIPLITASLASGSVFYIACFIAFLNLGQWTYGVSLLQNSDEKGNLLKKEGGKKESFGAQAAAMGKKLIKAPFMIAILIGCFFFFTQLPMPSVLGKCISNIAGLNTPIAMFTVGIYLAQTDIGRMFTKGRLYYLSIVRMLIIPAVTMLVLCILPQSMFDMKMAILIAAACPVGSNVAVYAQLHNSDYPYAVETVVISTLLSIVTMPIIVGLAGMIWM